MALDVFAFLTQLKEKRYRAVIWHAEPEKGAALTQFAQKVCQRTGGKYLDLLDFFIQSKELSESIDSFGPEKLRELLIKQGQSCSLLIVDRIDFLLDTWNKSERNDFYRLFNDQWDGFKEGMKARLIVCLQTSLEINNLQINQFQGQNRVNQLADFNDIA
jgi:hypothetical protein